MTNSEVFPWDHNFETGVSEIDAQHRILADLLNLLANQLAAHEQREPFPQDIFRQLKEYAVEHFSFEERLWFNALGDEFWKTGHHKAHSHFVDEILHLEMRKKEKTLDEALLADIVGFLTQWLVHHILESDYRIAKILLALSAGKDLQNAKKIADQNMSGENKSKRNEIKSKYNKLAKNMVKQAKKNKR